MVTIRRVSYGSAKTPAKDREYRMAGDSPVGTIAEWKAFMKQKGWERKLTIIERDGKQRTIRF